MTELWNTYWPMILVAVAIGIIVGFFIFRPKQRVTLTRDSAPVRPHMQAPARPRPDLGDSDGGGEGEGVASEMAAAASDVVGEVIGTAVHENLPGPRGMADDLQRMKGVGPKLAAMLQAQGLTRFEQIAALSAEDVEQLDAQLGAFRGRLARDRVIEQAAYLARGDDVGYERVFGKL
jgi:predicted flap endonuclease-1-like 5' DNA nuclease